MMAPANHHGVIGGLLRLQIGPFGRILLANKITPESARWSVNAMADLMMRASRLMDCNVVVGANAGMIAADPPLRVPVIGRLSIDID